MHSGRARNYRSQTHPSRGNKGLWLLIITSLLLVGLLALTFVARNQQTSLTTHAPPAAMTGTEVAQGPADYGTV